MAKLKPREAILQIKVDSNLLSEFRTAAFVRGSSTSKLIRQFMENIVLEEKGLEPAAFERNPRSPTDRLPRKPWGGELN